LLLPVLLDPFQCGTRLNRIRVRLYRPVEDCLNTPDRCHHREPGLTLLTPALRNSSRGDHAGAVVPQVEAGARAHLEHPPLRLRE
jgi:hypothetical protein